MKFLLLIARNVRRSYLRSGLTVLGTMVLVFVVTLVWSILSFLSDQTAAKTANFKAIVTERWQIPSQMPYQYADPLSRGAVKSDRPGDVKPLDSMTWQFFFGTTEQGKRTWETSLFAFVLDPRSINTMMDELDSLPPGPAAELQQLVDRMAKDRQAILIGRDRLKAINKQVGETIKLYGINYKDIDLEFKIIGMPPAGRYDGLAFFHRDYLMAAMDQYNRTHPEKHPLYDRTLNLVWLRVSDGDALRKVADQIESSSEFRNPQVKCETQSSGVASFIEAYRDLIWGMRYLLAPAVIITLASVISTAISIGVRERRTELAVMKVLGFRPWQLLALVIGEAVLLGAAGGVASAGGTYLVVNVLMGGFKFPIGFFSAFFIPDSAFWWGAAIGGGAAFAGSLFPALSARNVKVAEVFSKVT